MKRPSLLLSCPGFAVLLAASVPTGVLAQTSGSWNVNANGNWGATGSWLNGIIPNGADGTANFNLDINADRTITIDSPRTIGNLVFRDTDLASNAFLFGTTAGTNVLTLDNGAAKPSITVWPRTASGAVVRIDGIMAGTNGFRAVKGGTSTTPSQLALGSVAHTFSGSVLAESGVILRTDNNASFGTADALGFADSGTPVHFTQIASGATLNINGNRNLGSEYIRVAGTGADNTGAIVNTSTTAAQNAFQQVELTGDTTFGGAGRWDIRSTGAGRFYQNGFTLTKIGTNQVSVVGSNIVGNGTININAGFLSIETQSNAEGTGDININPGANLLFWGNTGIVTKPIVANGGIITAGANAAAAGIGSPITLKATTTVSGTNAAGILNLNGIISESGGSFGITKTGVNTLNLGGVNTFTGPVNVTGGNFGITGSLTGNNSLLLAAGSVLTINGTHTVGTGNTLMSGRPGAVAATDVTGSIALNTGSSLEVGTSARNGGVNPLCTLTLNGDLTSAGSTIHMDLGGNTTPGGGVSDLVSITGNLSLTGVTTINVTPVASLANGSYTLMQYSGILTGNASNLALSGLPAGGRQTFTLNTASTPGSVVLDVAGSPAANLIWRGNATTNVWDLNTTANFTNGAFPDVFRSLDSVTFDDSGSNLPAVAITGTLSPGSIVVNNPTKNYTFGGTGIIATGGLVKSGDGKLTITGAAHTFPSATISEGTVAITELNHANAPGSLGIAGNIPIEGATLEFAGTTNASDRLLNLGVVGGTIAVPGAGSTLTLLTNPGGTGPLTVSGAGAVCIARADAGFTFSSPLAGTGTLALNAHESAGSATSHQITLNGANNAFAGTLKLRAPASGTYRLNGVQPTALGTASIIVEDRAQLFTAASQTYSNNLTITGSGFLDVNASFGALRLENTSEWAGNILVNGTSRIGSYNTTTANGGTVSGNISGGNLEVNQSNYNNNNVVHFTGTNSYGATSVGGGNTQTAGVPSLRLNIGKNGTSGTLGTGPVTLFGDGANGVLGFLRSDGYTLAPGNTITADGANLARTFIDLDCTGTGFANAGTAIDLGTAGGTGGSIRVGVTVAEALATLTGTVETGSMIVGAHNTTIATTNASAVIGDGANLSATTIAVAAGGGTTPLGNTNGARLTVRPGASVTATLWLYAGEGNTSAGRITQEGGAVSVGQQVRLGQWPNATSTYDMNGGTLTLTGAPPILSPSNLQGGAANTAGDNNINALPVGAVVGGGIYLGLDGSGIFNHTGGTVSTNWIVLDNRGAAPANATAGEDQYNLTGGRLNLTSAYGIIARHPASTLVSLNGGTVANAAPAGVDVVLDAPLVLGSSGVTLDTTGNAFILTGNVLGTGSLTTTGAGTLKLLPNGKAVLDGTSDGLGITNLNAPILGNAAVEKSGTGSTSLVAANTYTGGTTVTAGTLFIEGSVTGATVVKTGGTLGGNGSAGAVTVEGGGIIAPGTSVGTLNASSVNLQAGSTYQVEITGVGAADKLNATGALTTNGTITVTLSGYAPVAGDAFDIADAGSTSGTPAFDFTAAVLSAGMVWDTASFATTGTIRVVAGTDPYETWATAKGLTGGDAAKGADPDGDGAINLLEFATNSDPKAPGSGARVFERVHTFGTDRILTLTVAVRKAAVFAAAGTTQSATKDGVTYTIEGTGTLTDWTSATVTKLNPADSSAVQAALPLPLLDSDWEWHTFRTDDTVATGLRDYIRLKVNAP